MFCSKCGAKNEDGAKFCVQCGNPLTPEASQGASKEKLENLYQLARRARDENNSENAQKYYEMILPEDPNSWEAAFYSVYFKAMECKIAQIQSAGVSVANCIDNVLNLIKEHVEDVEAQDAAAKEVASCCINISFLLYNGAKNHYNGISSNIRNNYTSEMIMNCVVATSILHILGDRVETVFHDHETLHAISVQAWKESIAQERAMLPLMKSDVTDKYIEKVEKYEPAYEPPAPPPSSGGCYVATAVYHSYDCPQVWTLRRFRDDILAGSWYGRAFVRLYYAVSPTLVRWFGETAWFQKLWRGPLDRLVARLQAKGVKDTPYEDKIW